MDIIQDSFNAGAQFDLAGDYETYLLTKGPAFWARFRRPQDYTVTPARKILQVNDYAGGTVNAFMGTDAARPGLVTRGVGAWPGAQFSGAQALVGSGPLTLANPFTAFMVLVPTDGTDFQVAIAQYNSGTANSFQLGVNNQVGQFFFNYGNGSVGLPYVLGKPNCVIACYDANGRIVLRLNGTEIMGSTNGAYNQGTLTIGAFNAFGTPPSPSLGFSGVIGEAAFFTALATDDPDMMDCLEGIAASVGCTIAGR